MKPCPRSKHELRSSSTCWTNNSNNSQDQNSGAIHTHFGNEVRKSPAPNVA